MFPIPNLVARFVGTILENAYMDFSGDWAIFWFIFKTPHNPIDRRSFDSLINWTLIVK